MFLAKSIAQKSRALGIDELVFQDINETKLNIYGKMAQQVALRLNPELKFVLTSDPIAALSGADYVITTIRVGEDEMRVRDERIALDLGLLGQETTGAAGFSFAMRSIPALKEYCEIIKKYSNPCVKVFNFTNPAGVVSQALRDMGYDFTFGICDAPSGMLRSFARLYNASPENITGECYGLNHLSYFNSIKLCGKEILPELIENDEAYKKTDMRYFEKRLLRERKCILNEYLYYFYYREKAVENILKSPKTRGELICEVNKNMLAELSKRDIENDFDACLNIFCKWYGIRESNYMAEETGIKKNSAWHFDIYGEDDGGYAGVALEYIKNAQSGTKGTMIMCIPNNGAVDGLRDDDVIEVSCDVSKDGCKAHKFGAVDEQNLEIIRRVKTYERLASKAIRERSRQAATEALTLHPLVNSYSLACELTDKYINLNQKYTGEWK